MLKKIVYSLLILSLLVPVNISPAKAEECPTYDFSTIFFEDYYPNKKWTFSGGSKIITWSPNAKIINGELVSRVLSLGEIEWIKMAIKSWDEVLESISFQQIDSETADLLIGWVPLTSGTNTSSYETYAYWNSWWVGDIRNRATIRMKQTAKFIQSKEGFIHVLQHEIGNVLGLGDIRPSNSFESVLEDPVQVRSEQVPLSNYDIGLIRQMYGESTCPSSWSKISDKGPVVIQEHSSENLAVLSELRQELAMVKAQNSKLIKKLAMICKSRPKPKGC
jgi:hypothetical protein